MGDRYYFGKLTDGVPGPVPSGSAVWDYASESAVRRLMRSKGVGSAVATTRIGPWTPAQTALDRYFVLDTKLAPQLIAGTVKAQALAEEFATTDNAFARMEIFLTDETGSFRAQLLSIGAYGPATEINSGAPRNKTFASAGTALTPVEVGSGGWLLWVGLGYTDAAGTTPEARLSVGGGDADLPEDETTADGAAWIEFSQTLKAFRATSSTKTADAIRSPGGRYLRTAYVAIFEGVGLAFTTTDDVEGIAAAWRDSDWQTFAASKSPADTTAEWFTGLFYPRDFKQEIDPFTPKIGAEGVSFRVLDPLGRLNLMIAGAARSPASCYLTQELDASSSTLVTTDTTTFLTAHPSGDYLVYCGNETMLVNAANRTANGWTFAERGVFSLFETDDGFRFSRAHPINQVNGLQPKITDTPRTWYNRGVAIYMHHFEDGFGWSSHDAALLVWSGRVKSCERQDRAYDFAARLTTEMLDTQILDDQFTAKVSEGRWVTEQMARVYVREEKSGITHHEAFFTLARFNQQVTAGQLATDLDTALREAASGLKFGWSLGRAGNNNFRIQMTTKGFATPYQPYTVLAEIGLDSRVWKMLGFPVSGGRYFTKEINGNSYNINAKTLVFKGYDGAIGKWEIQAELPPLVFDFTRIEGVVQHIQLEAATGVWRPQDVISTAETPPATAEGFVEIDGLAILQGLWIGAPTNRFVITQDVTHFFSTLGFSGKGGVTTGPGEIREGESGELKVRQIWYERAPVRELALRLILSTGVTGWNDDTFDVNARGMGCELPWSLLDVPSFKGLGEGDIHTLLMNQPTECTRILESIFAVYGRHLVWKLGKLTLVEPRSDGPTIAVAWTLNENNKADIGERIREVMATDGIINRVEVKFNRRLDGTFADTIPFVDAVSASDFGQKRPLVIEAWGVDSQGQGFQKTISKAVAKPLAYFSRPLTILERSIDKTLIQVTPGDTVLLSDNEAVDPRTGIVGMVNFPCWVIGVSFDYANMRGDVQLAYNAELYADKVCAWAPAARIDHTLSNAGYVVVDGATRYLGLNPFLYSNVVDGPSCERFDAGNVCYVRELSPADPFNPLAFLVTLASVDDLLSRAYLTATIAGWDPAKKYILQPAVWSGIVQAQKRDTFIAGITDNVNGPSIPTAYLWGSQKGNPVTAIPFTANKFVRPPRSKRGDWLARQGFPLVVSDYYELLYSLNSLLAYRTQNQSHMGAWTHGAGVTSTAARELLIFGRVPLYGWGRRPIRFRLFAKTGGALGTIYVTTSRKMPKGLSNSTVLFDDDVIGATSFTLSNAAFAWQAEMTVQAYPSDGFSQGFGPPWVYLTVEGQIASGAITIQGISASEGATP